MAKLGRPLGSKNKQKDERPVRFLTVDTLKEDGRVDYVEFVKVYLKASERGESRRVLIDRLGISEGTYKRRIEFLRKHKVSLPPLNRPPIVVTEKELAEIKDIVETFKEDNSELGRLIKEQS